MGNYEEKLNPTERELNKLGTITMYVSKNGVLGRKLYNQMEINKTIDAQF
jgi:hypothetical protein